MRSPFLLLPPQSYYYSSLAAQQCITSQLLLIAVVGPLYSDHDSPFIFTQIPERTLHCEGHARRPPCHHSNVSSSRPPNKSATAANSSMPQHNGGLSWASAFPTEYMDFVLKRVGAVRKGRHMSRGVGTDALRFSN